MAKAFNTIKSPALGLMDKLPFGKYKDCRICDIVDEEYDYLIWLEKNTSLLYNNVLVEKLKALANFSNNERYYEEEVLPFLDDVPY